MRRRGGLHGSTVRSKIDGVALDPLMVGPSTRQPGALFSGLLHFAGAAANVSTSTPLRRLPRPRGRSPSGAPWKETTSSTTQESHQPLHPSGQIPRSPALAMIDIPRFSMIVSSDEHYQGEKIDIVFDQSLVRRKSAEHAYRDVLLCAPELAKILARREPRFEDDKSFRPLQAADLLAYCARMKDDPLPRNDRVRRSRVLPALRDVKTMQITMDGDSMQYMRDRVQKRTDSRLYKAMRW
jgi:Protein of unknown function (DUF3800)